LSQQTAIDSAAAANQAYGALEVTLAIGMAASGSTVDVSTAASATCGCCTSSPHAPSNSASDLQDGIRHDS
jgi:hypothetical protein